MSRDYPLGLFEALGLELEYMIVDRESLAVRPIADELIRAQCGEYSSEIELGELAWSNELALHVIEFKTNGPARELDGLAELFQHGVERANALLEPLGARLMPGGMHPWMDPEAEMVLWPHESSAVYAAFDRIFDCRGHGWANLQSAHLNLPFADDAEFGRLHAAIRLVLPILPALAASSPVTDGCASGLLDARLEHYRHNARRIPSLSGRVIPEPCFTRADYERMLDGIYRDLAPHDPEGVLQHEWVNARGAIARFDRGSIEIRLLDVAECPRADLALARLVLALLRQLVDERLADSAAQRAWPVEPLAAILEDCIRDGERARISDESYLRTLGWTGRVPCEAGELWAHLAELALDPALREQVGPVLQRVLEQGPLARRILARLGGDLRREHLKEVYAELCLCLAEGRLFDAGV